MARTAAAGKALQDCLAFEYIAVYAYSLMAARMEAEPDLGEHLASSFHHHRKRRDSLLALIEGDAGNVRGPDAAYPVPEVTTADEATAQARRLESDAMKIQVESVGATTGPDRAFTIEALRASAIEALGWGVKPAALPGT